MSGLSRLAAAATQPDEQQHFPSGWEGGGGGTGLTPPSSPRNCNEKVVHSREASIVVPKLYRNEEDKYCASDGRGDRIMGTSTPSAVQQRPGQNKSDVTNIIDPVSTNPLLPVKESGLIDGTDDAGWSDEEFDFEDDADDDGLRREDVKSESEKPGSYDPKFASMSNNLVDKPTIGIGHEPPSVRGNHRHGVTNTSALVPSPPHSSEQQSSANTQHSRTFEEEFVMVLKDKIDAECQELKEHGRMKRWRPIREDPILRKQLMEVMIAQIQS